MATKLEVVNQCLAIMGEAPLNALTEEHDMKASALSILERNDLNAQGTGWWFNMEYLLLRQDPTDSRIHIPTDVVAVRPIEGYPDLVQRGRRMYDRYAGTDLFAEGTEYKARIVRRVPWDDLPPVANDYIARKTVLDFQNEYDGDQTKTRNLQAEVYGSPASAQSNGSKGLKGDLMSEHIRQEKVNFISQSERLSRITNRVNYSRRPR